MGSASPRHLTSLRTDGGPNSDPLHAAQGSCWLMASSGTNRVQSRWLALARIGSQRAQACTPTTQATYSLLTLHSCVPQDQIRKKLCVRVEFT